MGHRLSALLWKLSLVREDQRYRVRAHPHAYGIAVGVFLTGLVAILDPSSIEETATSLSLPGWLRTAFEVCWVLAGGLAAFGIARGHRGSEAAGMMLLATALFVDFCAFVYLRPLSAISGGFVLALSLTSLARAFFLVKGRSNLQAHILPTEDEEIAKVAETLDADRGY